ncbi:MAG TPA: methyltransferase domain-containing protein [Dehalococcoidales bacterium]|nr:methyltransferase domain-containing protein [Dehalococcoidales bacterium]
MVLENFKAKQLSNPRGIWSGYVAGQMNRLNVDINQTTVQLLEIAPSDKVLEIGFGGGDALHIMNESAPAELLVGIDKSDAMLRRGTKRFKDIISRGKMELKKCCSDKIAYQDAFFDKICAVNCIYFWPEPAADLQEIRRVMKQNGKLIISVYTQETMQKHSLTKYGFHLYNDSQLSSLLNDIGFKDVRLEHRTFTPREAIFAIGIKQ